MVFSSPVFLFAFLPATTLLLALVRSQRLQNGWLLLMSALFYLWGGGAAILVIAYVTVASYGAGWVPWAALRKRDSPVAYRALLTTAILALLLPLLLYKYIPPLVHLFPGGTSLADLALPLGISFFTFHAVSYVVDVGQGKFAHERSPREYALYLFVFPHQIAGPIVRYSEIRAELHGFRDSSMQQLQYGFVRFVWGLAKKVLVADPCGKLADSIFAVNASGGHLSTADAWLGALLYTLQIYFDFSGYSDMAIGIALMLGFHFPENFRQPYRSISVTEFWRRWHMTLSRWFRDYVYIPLGGNRKGPVRGMVALLVVFTLTSLWHGAALTFLIWGGLHSAMLVFERLTGVRKSTRLAHLRRIGTFLFIVVSWVPFRAGSLTEMRSFWTSMFGGGWSGLSPATLSGVTPFVVLALAIGCLSLVGPRRLTGFETIFVPRATVEPHDLRRWIALPVSVLLFAACAMAILWSNFSPFLYYRF